MKRLLMFCLLLCLALGAQSAQAAPFSFGAASFDDSLSLLENLETLAPGAFTPYDLGDMVTMDKSVNTPVYYNMIGVTELGMSSRLYVLKYKYGVEDEFWSWDEQHELVANWPASVISDDLGGVNISATPAGSLLGSTWCSHDNMVRGNAKPGASVIAYQAGVDIVYQPVGAEAVTFAAGTAFFAIDLGGLYGIFTAFTAQPQLGANPVPVPAAVWLLGSGLAGLGALRRKMA